MSRKTRIALVAGAAAVLGIAGLAAIAQADRGGWGGGHGWGMMGGGHGMGMMGGGHGMGMMGGGHGKHARFQYMLEQFDTDKDGKITKAEVEAVRQAKLATFDTDKNGALSLTEFEGLWMEQMRRPMVRGFQMLDADGDAAVTAAELTSMTETMFAHMDRNDDGVIDNADRRKPGRWFDRQDEGAGSQDGSDAN